MYADNVLKYIAAGMTKRGGDTRTDWIGRQCLDALDMWRGCSG